MTVTFFMVTERAEHLVSFLDTHTTIKGRIVCNELDGFVRVEVKVNQGSDFLSLYHAGIHYANNKNLKPIS